MNSFVGDYSCKLDDKGRVLFPAAFKKQWNGALDRFILKKDIFENCLVMYTLEEWERQVDMLRKRLNPYDKEQSRFLRKFYSSICEIELDSTGRMQIPKKIVEEVGLKKEVVFIGVGDKIELWDKVLHQSNDMSQEDFEAKVQKYLGGENE